ncbi:hypothetical protein R4Q14_04140 [Brachyspira intermedia]|uniref:hypothetical protein n=1 Tax=Brachyspira intermedia TaxID=84377 RepID=UPI0030062F99
MNKKLKYIVFIISVLIFILGCKNNGTNPITFDEIGKYRGTWTSDNIDMLNPDTGQFEPSGDTMTIKINSDTDVVIGNIVINSIKHLPDTIDSYNAYIPANDIPPEFSMLEEVLEAYYRLEFTSYNSASATMLVKFKQGEISMIFAMQKAELKKSN